MMRSSRNAVCGASLPRRAILCVLVAGLVTPTLQANAPRSDDPNRGSAAITEESVRETLGFLAGDPLLGRDTPSPGLTMAAEHIADRFEAAGLLPMDGDSFFLTYTQSGYVLDASSLQVRVRVDGQDMDLMPGVDVRIWSATDAFAGEDLQMVVFDPRTTGMNEIFRSRERPVLLLTPADSPLWTVTEGPREVLAGRRRGPPRPPTLLIREGAVPAGDATWSITMPAPEAVEVSLQNVGAILRGSKRPNEVVMFGAHYDHIGVRIPTPPKAKNPDEGSESEESEGSASAESDAESDAEIDVIMNGADDDASGTTAVILLAEAFAALEEAPDRSVGFLCFSGEEKGLLGSRAFCEDPPFALDEIVALFNIEMIGRPHEDKDGTAWVTGPGYSNFEAMVRPAFNSAGVELIEFGMQDRLFGASDNAPFARKGVVAHSISAGSLHDDYHGPDDEVDRIHVGHMTGVIRAIFAAGRLLAGDEERPAWTDAGREALKLKRG